MQITTVHTLFFQMTCEGNEQHQAAMAIVKSGAATLNLQVTVGSLPLLENAPVTERSTTVQVMAPTFEACEHYWMEVMRSLAFIGVEATSP